MRAKSMESILPPVYNIAAHWLASIVVFDIVLNFHNSALNWLLRVMNPLSNIGNWNYIPVIAPPRKILNFCHIPKNGAIRFFGWPFKFQSDFINISISRWAIDFWGIILGNKNGISRQV